MLIFTKDGADSGFGQKVILYYMKSLFLTGFRYFGIKTGYFAFKTEFRIIYGFSPQKTEYPVLKNRTPTPTLHNCSKDTKVV